MRRNSDAYQAWLLGELVLLGLLGASLALLLTHAGFPRSYALPHLKLVLQTVVALAAGLVAILTAARFSADGRRFDLLLCLGFFVTAASTAAFGIAPVVAEREPTSTAAWSGVVATLIGRTLIAAAPFADGVIRSHRRALGNWLAFLVIALGVVWALIDSVHARLPALVPEPSTGTPFALTAAYAAQALLMVVAVVGFGLRFRRERADLDRWLALGATLLLFSSLHLVFTPLLGNVEVSQGDFLRVLAYGVLCVGVWRAIHAAEFGRAVADERARLAREIHDGLAQYLFAISAQTATLEQGGDPEKLVPQLKEAAGAAQREARFAILALSSAGGSTPFDAALRRYVEFLSADGALDVELVVDPRTRLDPDEQIEVFRIVQEGLGNVRRHADAHHAEVRIEQRDGRRVVTISDDGNGFDGEETGGGQGLRNIRARIGAIGAALSLRTSPGAGTALEVTLRA